MMIHLDRRILARPGLLLAAGLVASCAVAPPSASLPLDNGQPEQLTPVPRCVAEYSALLDLAELARRYGTASGVFLNPLGDMFDQLDECLSGTRGPGGAPRGLDVRLEVGAAAPSSKRVSIARNLPTLA